MGAFQGEWHINLHISPTTSSFCPISLAMILIYSKKFQNTKNYSVWCAGWSDTAYGCSKSRIHATAVEAGGSKFPVLSSAALNLHSRAELETCKLGGSYPRSMPKPSHFCPQITPSDILVLKLSGFAHLYSYK